MNNGGQNAAKLTGTRFGRLVVIYKLGTKNNRILWLCRCDCGNYIKKNTNFLTMGHGKSCGCLRKDFTKKAMTTHGFCTPEATIQQKNFFKKWKNIKNRCQYPKAKDYCYYGARGIKVLWNSFEEFKKDTWNSFCKYLETHTLKEATIDRIDNNGNYCKDNCRWVNQSIQVKNRRNLKIKV